VKDIGMDIIIEKIETQITELEREIKEIPKQKEYILKKYM
jgi:hypothetical protein